MRARLSQGLLIPVHRAIFVYIVYVTLYKFISVKDERALLFGVTRTENDFSLLVMR